MSDMTPAQRAWLTKLRDEGPTEYKRGVVRLETAMKCMRKGWTEWVNEPGITYDDRERITLAGLAALAEAEARDYDKVLTYIETKLGDQPAHQIQMRDVIRARDANADAVRFANYIVQVTRIIMRHAMMEGWRTDNPAQGVPLLKGAAKRREPWPDAKVAAFRAEAAPETRARLIFELCLGTGQRIGDVLRMRWNDIEGGGIKVRQGKTGAELWVPLTAHLKAVLDVTPKRGLTICAQPNGRPTSYRGAADLIMAVRRKIGAECYDNHALRYTAAAELAEAGCSDELIMAVTGHTTARMVGLYAGKARQRRRAQEAQEKRK